MTAVVATVRLQFHRNFTFDDAVPLVGYFKDLGISHIYASPILKARAGSTHGYDLVDPRCVNPELGSEEALGRLVQALRSQGMGLLVDIVCNHMAVGGEDNPWWQSVLEWGDRSPYAQFFDIQWDSPDPLLKGQLLLPFLSDSYGEVLAAGKISLHFERETGEFYVRHYDHRFPLNPAGYAHILARTGDEQLMRLGACFALLADDPEAEQKARALRRQLSEAGFDTRLASALGLAMSQYDTSLPVSDDQARKAEKAPTTDQEQRPQVKSLHELLELQHYRLASWRTAADDINWRRFFDVNELGGLRVERPEVFEACHAKVFELIERGWIDGLRIDHVDGLANPRAYCRKLRRRLDWLNERRPAELRGHLPIYVEKILADGEHLAQDWLVDGTTGYEFMNQVSLLQHDPLGELQLFDLWSKVSGRLGTFKDEVRLARHLVLSSNLAGDVETVAQLLLQIARQDITTRDLTLGAIRRALIELVAHFPVYRTYSVACNRSEQDQAFFTEAINGARLTLAESDWPLLDFLDRWLGGEALHELPPGPYRQLRRDLLARFQQLTSPAAAKAVEDTACYRSAVLLSRNDVGFDPQHFSAPLASFHQKNEERAQLFPANMLATATHDHKRGEDTRARLAVISERSVWFAEKAQQWQAMASNLRKNLDDGAAPSPADELILFQALLGSWPLDLAPDNAEAMAPYLKRMLCWQEKAVREAKLRSVWSAPNEAYESASRSFLTALLMDSGMAELRAQLHEAANAIAIAGALNGLTQTLLRISSPGLPDLYQGTEFWDFSLVDPDNRQPVDFGMRVAALKETTTLAQLLDNWRSGKVKQWLIGQALKIRHKYMQIFAEGDYRPLAAEGEQAEQLVIFARTLGATSILVIAPRLVFSLLGDSQVPLVPAANWGDNSLPLPEFIPASSQLLECLVPDSENRLQELLSTGRQIPIRDLLGQFPVNLLVFNTSFSGD